MDIRDEGSFPGTPEDPTHALGIITVIVVVAGFTMVAAWFALLMLDESRNEPVARAATTLCNICGVVERVSEIQPLPPQALEGSRAEGAVILLAALGGAAAPGGRQAAIYETSVLHDDGSVRVLRNFGVAPQWTLGDRVKVVKGRVEPVFSIAEKKPSPAPQATQVR